MTRIDTMSLADLNLVLAWASAEGWNPGLDDAAAFHAADPEGFLVARDGDSPNTATAAELLSPAAAISVVRHDVQNAFLGLYICHPDYRGQGIGWSVWQAGIEKLQGYSIGLDGVLAQQDNYRKSGFELAYRNVRYAGTPHGLDTSDKSNPVSNHQAILPGHMPAIRSLDHMVHGIHRHAFLDHWLHDTPTRHSLVSRCESEVLGYGTIRACQQGHKVGPLIAQDKQQAHSLLSALVQVSGAQEIILDVPEPNSAAVNLAETMKLEAVFETARMYRGTPPEFQLDHLFGVTTFELG